MPSESEKEKQLVDLCHVNSNYGDDTFVGIKYGEDLKDIQVCFPLGYRLGKEDKDVRQDIILLLRTLAANTERQLSEHGWQNNLDKTLDRPIGAYIYVLKDFLMRGYYKESVVEYVSSKRGKINWNRTIKTKRPMVQDTEIFYLDFITKKNVVNETDIITMIHHYCVYRSFQVIGWLFTNYLPVKPILPFNRNFFTSALTKKLSTTYSDSNKLLFQNLLKIVKYESDDGLEATSFTYGTNRFEYVWEKMLDKSFGIENKNDYFPKTFWTLDDGKEKPNSVLEPNSIMLWGDNIYVLDAKYYKFGNSVNEKELPESTSINKQITYGEYIAENKALSEGKIVYNAFIMPFDMYSKDWAKCKAKDKHSIGIATSSWKHSGAPYESIVGVLLDVKHLMELAGAKSSDEIAELARVIEERIALSKK